MTEDAEQAAPDDETAASVGTEGSSGGKAEVGGADGSSDGGGAADAPTDPDDPTTHQSAAGDRSKSIKRCDYCRLPCPTTVVTLERDDVTYEFCSKACRDALEGSDRVFTEYHGYRRLEPGVSALDSSLPEGIPRNSFVMLTDLAGTRTEALQAELVWRALQRGEPVVFMSFLEPPVSVIQEFLSLEWNVLPSLEDGDLHILDCFTYRVDDRDRMQDRMSTWNAHLQRVAEQSTTTVRDPSDVSQLENRLDGVLEEMDMQDQGIVVVDTLTELGSLVQPVQAYNFVKNVRADVCKGRFVPIFAGATLTGDGDGFPHDLRYMVDGIVEMRLNEELVDGALVKQIRTRKMSGVLTYPEWESYEYTAGRGIVTFDPLEELEAARARAQRSADDEDTSQPPGENGGSGSVAADDEGHEGGEASDDGEDTEDPGEEGEGSDDGSSDGRTEGRDGDDVAAAATEEEGAASGESPE
ncbi:MAG: ATPase domain-containing protein [Haloarculaceae archaeon]